MLVRDSTPSNNPTSSITAETLSEFFVNKVSDIREGTSRAAPATYLPHTDQSLNEFRTCSLEEVRRVILSSPPKSCPLDPIPTFILREFLDDLLPYIWLMCSTSLSQSHLPHSQKGAIVTPVLKKTGLDPDDPKNYRPISNLTFLSKIIERLVVSRLSEYLNEFNLLPSVQSAYRSGHSTETAVLKVASDIWGGMDRGKVTLLRLLDLSAAFDTVDHDILLNRLNLSYGIGGNVIKWLESFVRGRTQTVAFNDKQAQMTYLEYGVPQGSVLGPLLFVLYTADICDIAKSHGVGNHAYADDQQLYLHCFPHEAPSAVNQFVACFTDIEQWMRSNRLKLNTDKTEIIWLGTSHKLSKVTVTHIHLGDCEIKPSSSVRNLGVIFDRELKLVPQVNSVSKSCFYQIRQLKSIRRLVTVDAAKTLVHAFVSSRVDYCNSLYYGATDGVHKKLQSVLNAAARLVTGQRRNDHISSTLRDLHWLRVPKRVEYKVASLTRCCMLHQGPQYLTDHLIPVNSLQARSHLRSANRGDLVTPRSLTAKTGGCGFEIAGPKIWNSLPPNLRNYDLSCASFKSNLKTQLFE